MTKTKLLIGSLSNDLLRVACLSQRGSHQAAAKFLTQINRWIDDLSNAKLQPYIEKIITELQMHQQDVISLDQAEKYLTYSILLQNYALHMK